MRRTTTVLLAAALAAAPFAGTASADDPARQPAEQHSQFDMSAMPSDEIIGSEVFDNQGKELGNVNKLLIGQDGKVHSAVISLGGILGLGDRKVKVPWTSLQVKQKPDDPDDLIVTASRDTLQNAPQFEGDMGTTARPGSATQPEEDPRAAGAGNVR
jgi:sporulation protein YlmC with PRC-barrel domain